MSAVAINRYLPRKEAGAGANAGAGTIFALARWQWFTTAPRGVTQLAEAAEEDAEEVVAATTDVSPPIPFRPPMPDSYVAVGWRKGRSQRAVSRATPIVDRHGMERLANRPRPLMRDGPTQAATAVVAGSVTDRTPPPSSPSTPHGSTASCHRRVSRLGCGGCGGCGALGAGAVQVRRAVAVSRCGCLAGSTSRSSLRRAVRRRAVWRAPNRNVHAASSKSSRPRPARARRLGRRRMVQPSSYRCGGAVVGVGSGGVPAWRGARTALRASVETDDEPTAPREESGKGQAPKVFAI